MRPDQLYLADMLEAADNIGVHLGQRPREAFLGDVTARAAVLHELTVIGEAASRISAELRLRHTDVAWAKIVAFSNFVVHEYFGLDWSIVWETATSLVPALREQIQDLVLAEFPPE